MLQEHIRMSDDFKEDITRRERISYWYNLAVQEIIEGKATILGNKVNPNNPKEVIAFLYLMYKDYTLFHEPL